MKKIIFIVLLIIIFLSIYIYLNKKKEVEETSYVEEQRGVFISYIDYSFLKHKTKEEQKKSIDKIIENIKSLNFNMIILQVRPFCDAIYKSFIFSSSKVVVENEGDELKLDILKYFIDKSHENNISLHAWINPYRIRNTNNISDISKDNVIYQFLDTDIVEKSSKGIYLNPSKKEVLNLILTGIREIVLNYDVDGIIYDDYFYPSNTIDINDYEKYKELGGTLTIDEYRINNINILISESYKLVKSLNSNVLFGISPAGNINNNLNSEYLDIEFILQNNNYLDYVMPQIYYGFKNQTLPFIKTIKVWNDLILNNDTKLLIALALYKSGIEDTYAISGKNEWIENGDIIKNQILVSRSLNKYQGFAIFRYDYLFYDKNDNANLIEEITNIKQLLN